VSRWRLALGVLIAAALASAFAICFRLLLGQGYRLINHTESAVEMMRQLPVWVRVALPAVGGFAAGGVVRLLLRHGAGGDVMEALVLGKSRIPLKPTMSKSLASLFALVSGNSIGREGPMMQAGAAFGSKAGEWLKLDDPSRRILIAAGCGAGFAAAYNTPFAAVLFVLEVVLGVVVLDAVVPVMVAVVISTALCRVALGAGPIYGARAFSLRSGWELVVFAGLGLAVALGAQLFMRLLSFSEHAFNTPKLPLPWRTAAGGALAGAVAALLPEVAGNGYEPLNELLDAHFTLGFVAMLLLGKALATVFSVGGGNPGGVFTPTLLLGGAIGFLYAHAASALGLDVGPSGGYALAGMAAATAATTHAPVMAAVMAFELSGDYGVVLPLALCTAVATAVSRGLRQESLYKQELRETNQLPQ
jgi:CIC family chloride channel protein